MSDEIISIFSEVTIDVAIMAVCVWGLTMIIKMPIKKFSAELNEDKRKFINSTIILIPLILSFVINSIYSAVTEDNWLTYEILISSVNVWLLSLSMYALLSKSYIIVKEILESKIKIKPDLSAEEVGGIKFNIEEFKSRLKSEEKELKKTLQVLNKVLLKKKDIENNISDFDDDSIVTIDTEIKKVKNKEENLKNKINLLTKEIESFTNKLYIKKEN